MSTTKRNRGMLEDVNKISIRTRSILAGVFILVAYGVLVSTITDSAPIIFAAEVISGLAVIGIAVMLFPALKPGGKILCIVYLCLKLVEGILMVGAGAFYLFESIRHLRDWIYTGIHVYAFIVSAFILYYLIFVTRVIPRFIAVWGMVAIGVQLVSTILGLLYLKPAFINYFLVLIITNEVFMAIWLMAKGLKTESAIS